MIDPVDRLDHREQVRAMRLATEGLPTEEYDLEYRKVTVETWWTDNATGDRKPERPYRVSWDLQANKSTFEDAGSS